MPFCFPVWKLLCIYACCRATGKAFHYCKIQVAQTGGEETVAACNHNLHNFPKYTTHSLYYTWLEVSQVLAN